MSLGSFLFSFEHNIYKKLKADVKISGMGAIQVMPA